MKANHVSKYLLGALLILPLLLLAGCPDNKQNSEIPAPEYLTTAERSVFRQINDYRQSQGLPILIMDTRIVDQARNHSRNMADGTVPFSHQGFKERVQKTDIPNQASAENVAYYKGSSDPATQTVQGWLKSEGHLHNIVGDFNLTGIGVIVSPNGTYYFTQIFMNNKGSTEQAPKNNWSPWNWFR